MKLAISCRIAEGFLNKEEASMSLAELADLAVDAGYESICMRASQIGIHTPSEKVAEARKVLDDRKLNVSMVSGDFDIVYNNDKGPSCLRNVTPYLDLAEQLGSSLIRICIKYDDDIAAAQRAADEAAERGIRLAHQCHTLSLFETVDQIVDSLQKIDRPNFGLIYEAANLEECRQDYGLETIRRLAPWIVNVYVQNQLLKPDGAVTLDTWCHGPINFDIIDIHDGRGIDFGGVFEALRQVGYAGNVTVHQSAPEDGSSSVVAASKTADFLRQCVSS